eukprot:687371-Pyramimonas_sp.AAC.1
MRIYPLVLRPIGCSLWWTCARVRPDPGWWRQCPKMAPFVCGTSRTSGAHKCWTPTPLAPPSDRMAPA